MPAVIVLQSSDNETFKVRLNAAKKSGTIREMMDLLGVGKDQEEDEAMEEVVLTKDPVPLANVEGKVLAKVLEWCSEHESDPEPAEEVDYEKERDEPISDFDKKFMEVDQQMLYRILKAANYLEIKGLANLGSRWVANMITGKTPEEIRATFNIQNDIVASA